mmetsp:Transcript_60/g.197  ORF Transcript_60/g.197 Transcript_60/m.197 type:complete len:207 (-) Transcript_60:1401-2021(-)
MSKPRAATSVQMRNFISPDLKAAKLALRSSMVFAPPKTAQEYAEVCALATLSYPHLLKKLARLSQSKFVRQKIIHFDMECASINSFKTRGLSILTASDNFSFASLPSQSNTCTPSVETNSFKLLMFAFSSWFVGSMRTHAWCTESGMTGCLPFKSTQVGFTHSLLARRVISGECKVAENMRVCKRSIPTSFPLNFCNCSASFRIAD